MRHDLRTDRIQHDVPAQFKQMRVFFHQNRREAPLKHMPDLLVPEVVGLRVAAIQLPHAEREIRLRRLDQQMIVIVHQTVGMAHPPIAIDNMGQQAQPLQAVPVVSHDVLPGVAPTRDMVDGAGE